MRQLPLEISTPPAATLENFLPGGNAEALSRVRGLANGQLREAIVYLWGASGSGRSHLLQAAGRANPELVVADDVETLDEAAQQALFSAINAARDGRVAVLAAGSHPPLQLELRDDLRTRLAWGLVYQMKPLTEQDKLDHLRANAQLRGLEMPSEVGRYLLTRLPRDLYSLNAAIDLLDRFSLAHQRALTIPMVRAALADPAARAFLPRQSDFR